MATLETLHQLESKGAVMSQREMWQQIIFLGRVVDHYDDLHLKTRSGVALRKCKEFDAKRRDLQLIYQKRYWS